MKMEKTSKSSPAATRAIPASDSMAVMPARPLARLKVANWVELKLPLVKLPVNPPPPGAKPPVPAPVTALRSGSLITTSTRPTAMRMMLVKTSLLANTCRVGEKVLGLYRISENVP